MNRRDFLKKSSGLIIIAGTTACISRCKSLHDFYSFDGSLRNSITWTNCQVAVVSAGSEGTYDTAKARFATVIKDGSYLQNVVSRG